MQAIEEVMMFEPACRRGTILATVLLALMAPQPAVAQDPFALPGDILRLRTRQWQLRQDQARVQADLDRGDTAAMTRDLLRVRRDERRIETDRWLLRSDLFLPLAFTTHPQVIPQVPANPALIAHPQYPGYGYFPFDPTHLYRLPQPASVADAGTTGGASAAPAPMAAQVPIEIINAGPPGTTVECVVAGITYQIEGGRRRSLAVGPGATIAYDRGGGLGPQRYSLSAGVYEFRPGESGWALFRLRP